MIGVLVSLSQFRRPDGWLGASARFVFCERVTSTHDVLRDLAEDGAPEGTVVLAEEQTAGRGRLGRRWLSTPGGSLLLSMLFRPPEPFLHYAQRVTMICGLALREAVYRVTGIQSVLKWPNDLIVERDARWRKLAGILTEIGTVAGKAPFLMVGIGLNVDVYPELQQLCSPMATSLLTELGHSVDRAVLLVDLLLRVEGLYKQLCAGWDPLPDWRSSLAWLGRTVQVKAPTGEVWGVAEDVLDDGTLVLRLENGALVPFPVGDVSLRL